MDIELGVVTDMIFPVRNNCPSRVDRRVGLGTDWRYAPAWLRLRKGHAISQSGLVLLKYAAIVDFLLTKAAFWWKLSAFSREMLPVSVRFTPIVGATRSPAEPVTDARSLITVW
jgi:hypothetical protein